MPWLYLSPFGCPMSLCAWVRLGLPLRSRTGSSQKTRSCPIPSKSPSAHHGVWTGSSSLSSTTCSCSQSQDQDPTGHCGQKGALGPEGDCHRQAIPTGVPCDCTSVSLCTKSSLKSGSGVQWAGAHWNALGTGWAVKWMEEVNAPFRCCQGSGDLSNPRPMSALVKQGNRVQRG